MEARELTLLKRKLEALNYTQDVDASSAPLVQALVEDLVHTTESYRALKLQSSRQGQEIHQFNNQVEVLRKDAGRLTAENNALHVELIKDAEKLQKAERDHYQESKRLDSQIAELAYWRNQTVEKFRSLEAENHGLKCRIEELLGTARGMDLPDQEINMTISQPLEPLSPKPAPQAKMEAIDLVRSADARIKGLEEQVVKYKHEADQLATQLEELKGSHAHKEQEIERLGSQLAKGQDLERLDLQYRNEANESIIVNLNQQVDYLTAELAHLEGQVADKQQTAQALAKSEKARVDTVQRLEKALKENADIVKQVQDLQRGLIALRGRQSKNGKALATERDSAISTVAELVARLSDVQNGTDKMKNMLDAANTEKRNAVERERILQQDIDHLKAQLEEIYAANDVLKSQVCSTKTEVEDVQKLSSTKDGELRKAHDCIRQLEDRLEQETAAIRQLCDEKGLMAVKLGALQDRVAEMETSAKQQHTSIVDLEAQRHKSLADTRRLEHNLVAAESELDSLRERVKELSQHKIRSEATIQAIEGERQKLQNEVPLLTSQLHEQRKRDDALTSERDRLQMELGRLQTEVSMLQNEKHFLNENLASSTSRWKEGQQKLTLTTRELAQLQSLPQRIEELQEQIKDYSSQLSTSEANVVNMKAENHRLAEALTSATDEVDDLKRTLDDAECERNELRLKLEETEHQTAGIVNSIRALEAERDRERDFRNNAESELSRLRESLNQQVNESKDLEFTIKSFEQKVRALQAELLDHKSECERLQQVLDEGQETTGAVAKREEAARAQCRDLGARLRRAEASNEEYEVELLQVRSQNEANKARAQHLDELNTKIRTELDNRRKEVEQLTTLSLKTDATVQEYMKNLKTTSASLKAAQAQISHLEDEVQQRDGALEQTAVEISDLGKTIQALDAERDRLQDELDSKTEAEAQMRAELEASHRALQEASNIISATEGRLSQSSDRIRDLEDEILSLRQQNETIVQNLQALQSDHDELKNEYQAISDDLEALVKENQVVSGQLASVRQARDKAGEELRDAHGRLVHTEQVVRVKETELEDLRQAYENLGNENRQLQSSMSQMEREGAAREAELHSRSSQVAALQEAQRSGQMQINQYFVDLQALERQVDHLSRDLSKKDQELEDSFKEREVLLEQLRAAEQVRFDMENTRENLQRQLAALDTQLTIAKTRQDDTAAEVQNLNYAVQLKGNKVRELEGLLLQMRQREFKIESDSQASAGNVQILEERNKLLEEQASELQRQLQELREARNLQQRECDQEDTACPQGSSQPSQDMSVSKMRELRQELTSSKLELESVRVEKTMLEGQLRDARRSRRVHTSAESESSPTSVPQELKGLRERVKAQEGVIERSSRDIEQFRKDNHHLLDMLGKLDTEKAHLQKVNAALSSEVHALQSALNQSPQSLAQSLSPVESRTGESSTTLAIMEARLKEEQERRCKAERDFQGLVDSMQASPQTADGDSASELSAKIHQLQLEKRQLEENLQKSERTMKTLHKEVSRVRSEYGNAGATLGQLMSGLEGIGSSGQSPSSVGPSAR
eukprot:evm.model.scf_534.11 EVM.evm.TU.scf_534.11   scf_534:64730-78765(+)